MKEELKKKTHQVVNKRNYSRYKLWCSEAPWVMRYDNLNFGLFTVCKVVCWHAVTQSRAIITSQIMTRENDAIACCVRNTQMVLQSCHHWWSPTRGECKEAWVSRWLMWCSPRWGHCPSVKTTHIILWIGRRTIRIMHDAKIVPWRKTWSPHRQPKLIIDMYRRIIVA